MTSTHLLLLRISSQESNRFSYINDRPGTFYSGDFYYIRIMKKIFLLTALLLCVFAATAQSPQKKYIDKYSALAVEEMYRSGIPASITLAQGMLESGNGLSELAVRSNNHFGIKCHNSWAGARVYHDDDEKGECFRKYDTPHESFRDHSDFLRYRDRYKFLFDLELTDYSGWAHGLRKAGYATDPKYPQKLIKLIEEYRLYEFDTQKVVEPTGQVREIPQSPVLIEQVKPLTERQRVVFKYNLSRQMYSQNGVPFIYAAEGETYASIAGSYRLFLKEILKYNELEEDGEPAPGTVVYLQKKKNKSAAGLDKYVVEGQQNLREISQRFAIRLNKLCKLNGITKDHVLKEGDIISLR